MRSPKSHLTAAWYSVAVVCLLWPGQVIADGKPTTKCKYVVCMLYPKAEVTEGTFESSIFEQRFRKDYAVFGERGSPPADSVVDGVLLVSDGQTLVTLPIVHWPGKDGKTVYLCQGTSKVGKAPEFEALAYSRESLVQQIKEKLKQPE